MGELGSAYVRVRVPSKVNLFLRITGVRSDGYHELVTVLQTLSIHDTVVAELDRSGVSAHPAARRFMELAFTADGHGGVPLDGSNLAVRAARCLMDHLGIGTAVPVPSGDGVPAARGVPRRPSRDDGHRADGRSPTGPCAVPDPSEVPAAAPTGTPVTRLHLTKRIPVAAGMAGGSADAAAALVALNHLWQADLDRDELRALAARLGSDVPFCVGGGTALATGTGVATAQVLARGTYHWVVGVTEQPLSTPQVYRAFDEVGLVSDVEPDAVLQALRTGDDEALGAALHNDLEVAAFHLRPELVARRDAMLSAGALGAIVSGSGPTGVALARSAQHALQISAEVEQAFDRVEIALSPAGGPEIAGG